MTTPSQHGCGGPYCQVPGCAEYQRRTGQEWNPNPLAAVIAELGGKCDCGLFICECSTNGRTK